MSIQDNAEELTVGDFARPKYAGPLSVRKEAVPDLRTGKSMGDSEDAKEDAPL